MAEDDLPEDEAPEAEGPAQPNASDARSIAKQNEKARVAKNASVNFWRRALVDPVGRQELWDYLVECGCFDNRFACGPNGFPQPEATWFQAGEKAAAERLYWKLAGADHALVVLMHQEFDTRPAFERPEPEGRRRKPKGD